MSGKSIVGVDIEPGYVAAVQGSEARLAVERAAYAPLPGGVVREGEVIDVEEFTPRRARSPHVNFADVRDSCIVKFSNQRRKNVGTREIKIIVWPIEVRGHR